jgi:SpoVK/Ycf46/Vps4 family AAA+-type ATPase
MPSLFTTRTHFFATTLFLGLCVALSSPLKADCPIPGENPRNPELVMTLEGMVGNQPKLLCWIMHQFKGVGKRSVIFLNRLLMYGPPGNGKSMIAKKFAESTNSHFIARSACSMVERYVGQGASNVAEIFAKALEHIRMTGQKVVVFIDEIDALAGSNNSEFKAEHKAALQQLWIELDQIKDNPNIIVLFATNEFKKLNKTFLDRFGCNTLEITNPGLKLRTQVLTHYFYKADLIVEKTVIEALANKSKDLSIRSLEDMVYAIKMAADLEHDGQVPDKLIWESLAKIRDKVKNNTSDEEAQEKKLQKTSTIVSIVSGILSSSLNAITLGGMALGLTQLLPAWIAQMRAA